MQFFRQIRIPRFSELTKNLLIATLGGIDSRSWRLKLFMIFGYIYCATCVGAQFQNQFVPSCINSWSLATPCLRYREGNKPVNSVQDKPVLDKTGKLSTWQERKICRYTLLIIIYFTYYFRYLFIYWLFHLKFIYFVFIFHYIYLFI